MIRSPGHTVEMPSFGMAEPFSRVEDGDVGNAQWKGVLECQVARCDCGTVTRLSGVVCESRGGSAEGTGSSHGQPVSLLPAAGENEERFCRQENVFPSFSTRPSKVYIKLN